MLPIWRTEHVSVEFTRTRGVMGRNGSDEHCQMLDSAFLE
jgi:hypothetical protein